MATDTSIPQSFLQQPAIAAYLAANPSMAAIASQIQPGSPEEDILQNLTSNPTANGAPVTPAMVTLAFNAYNAKLQPGFQQAQLAEETNTLNDVTNQNAQYQDFLAGQANKFGIDKAGLDSAAASQNGVLEGSARTQKQNNLANQYNLAAASQLANSTAGIQKSANDYAADYGSAAANTPSLSGLYNLGTNTYDAGTGKVNQGAPTKTYNPLAYGYAGTVPTANLANAEIGASGLLKAYQNQGLGAFGASNAITK